MTLSSVCIHMTLFTHEKQNLELHLRKHSSPLCERKPFECLCCCSMFTLIHCLYVPLIPLKALWAFQCFVTLRILCCRFSTAFEWQSDSDGGTRYCCKLSTALAEECHEVTQISWSQCQPTAAAGSAHILKNTTHYACESASPQLTLSCFF